MNSLKKRGITLIEILLVLALFLILLALLNKALFQTIKLSSYGNDTLYSNENINILVDEMKKYIDEASYISSEIQYENNSSISINTKDSKGNIIRASISNLDKPLLYIETFNIDKPYFLVIKRFNNQKLLYKYYSSDTADVIIGGFDNIEVISKDHLYKVKIFLKDKEIIFVVNNLSFKEISEKL